MRNFIMAFFCFIVLVLLTFYSLRFYTKHGEGVFVPMLKNLPVTKATELLEKEGLSYQVDSVYVMGKAPGIILDYEPEYQSFVKTGRTIYLIINTMVAPDVKFPDIEFKSLKEVSVILSNYGLKLGDTTYKSDVSRNVVLETKFAGVPLKTGQIIPKGSKIDLVLGNGLGNSEIEIPNLIGLTKDEALFALKGSSLRLGDITYAGEVRDSSAATIVSQSPSMTDSIKTVVIGSRIQITLKN